jgi:hypothetical protein
MNCGSAYAFTVMALLPARAGPQIGGGRKIKQIAMKGTVTISTTMKTMNQNHFSFAIWVKLTTKYFFC